VNDAVNRSQDLTTSSLADRIRAQRLSLLDRRPIDEFLKAIEQTADGEALRTILADHPNARALADMVAAGSPFLFDLIVGSPARWLDLLRADPQTRLAAIVADIADAANADQETAMRRWRQARAQAALLIAMADIGGVWDVVAVTAALTQVADAAVGAAVRQLLREAQRAGQLTFADPDELERGCGYFVLALGKMGACELNYSSDIDLIVMFDPAVARPAPGLDLGMLFVRMTRNLIKLLQERTIDGYVFRIDVRLRPDPGSTQIAVSVPFALDYYERRGQNWERAALIKARVCAGDCAAGEALLVDLAPFVWRKYLDYVALADVHAMKQQIHVYRGHGEIAVEGHNIKLGRGGIREIEFFVQTQQLIAGGRNPDLRSRETLTTLAALARFGWITAEACRELEAAYRFLRTVEHRLQMVGDEQTHTLPADADALLRFARFMDLPNRDAFANLLLMHLRNVQRHYANLFEAAPVAPGTHAQLAFDVANRPAVVERLARLGFKQPAEAAAMIERWLGGYYPSLRGSTAREQFAELLPGLLEQLAQAENPEAALATFDRFLGALRGGARFYVLLRQNRAIVALLATILASAPRLADILAQQPDVIDAVLDPAFFGALPDATALDQGLNRFLAQSESFEDSLDRGRLFGLEHMFLIGVRVISGTITAEQAGEAFARLAEILIRAMARLTLERFVADHGRIAGQEIAILAMGKLGGREMTAGSDLDLMVIYEFDDEHPTSDGRRPLTGSHYFARFTQRLISTLTSPTNYGRLYAVDMRLRPSGRSGPLATSFPSFSHYQHYEAWTWEHMALTRARVIVGSPAFTQRIEATIHDVLERPRDPRRVAADVVDMRRAIAAERSDAERWNIKDAAGGLVDVEFVAQYLQLAFAATHPEVLDQPTTRVLEKAARLGLLAPEHADVLLPAARLYHNLTQVLRLCVTAPFDPRTAGPKLLQLLAHAGDVPDFGTLEAYLIETQMRVRRTFEEIVGRVG
jgi:[glutamine synthetase] adenylyltransferase / [glutamine synthetase]-adenylyl-L-tyrosine phosphorylase